MFLNKKVKVNKSINLYSEEIINQLKKYDIFNIFLSKEELENWILELNSLEVQNILSLNIRPEIIKFDPELLINKNLLNTLDYNKRVEALVSIKNAEGWYHLFDRMLRPEFLYSDKFYKDIEILKKAECAQTPLWIIGESSFINSPYHDEDFELLVTSKDTSNKNFDYVVWDAIATVAGNIDSINSEYHRQDLQTIIKYGAVSLQISHSYPESSINNLAINKVSLKDQYHLENMEILANNTEIGNFLYAVMTNQKAIRRRNYRSIIREMVENKGIIGYVFLVCYYAIGEKATLDALNLDVKNICLRNHFTELKNIYNIDELLEKIDERINIIDTEFKEISTYEIEYNESIKNAILKKTRN